MIDNLSIWQKYEFYYLLKKKVFQIKKKRYNIKKKVDAANN